MNIGIVTTWFPSGGGYVSKAYRDILAEKHNVFIYARGGRVMKGDPIWDDENVTWDPRHYNFIQISYFIKWVKKNKIGIVFFNEQRYWKPIIILKKMGICIGSYVDYYRQSMVPAFQLYDFLICNTKRHYSVFDWHKYSFYIPWGTSIEKFSPTLKKLNRPLTFLISLGWEGIYTEDRKGLLLAIDAFMKAKGDCVLLIYSQIELIKCLSIWQEKIAADTRIHFIHGTFDPFPFSEGDIYLYPSRLDGIGLSLPEALSCGLPAITTDNAPMNEFVNNNYNGSLVKVKRCLAREDGYYWPESICDVASLTDAIQKYIDNKQLAKIQGNAARELAERDLDWKINSKPLLKIFENALKNRTELNDSLIVLGKSLDRRMAPTFAYRVRNLFVSFLFYVRERASFWFK